MKVLIAGSTGLVGSALVQHYSKFNYELILPKRESLDLLDRLATFEFIGKWKPDLVIDSAALVGGIQFNSTHPADFISNNLQIQINLMDASRFHQIKNFVFLGSSCIYPRECPQPIKEEYLMSGPLEPTNSAYAIAKIAGMETVKSIRKQFGLNWVSVMPTNVYGPRDNFNLANAHVMPALIRRFIEAKESNKEEIVLWGDGSAMREFIHSSDLADAINFVQENYHDEDHINIGVGNDISIKELANMIANLIGFKGQISWDKSKPNGTPRKLLDISRISELGWKPKINLEQGIQNTIDWFFEARKTNTARL